VTGHDGEHIDDLLQTAILPDVVVMIIAFQLRVFLPHGEGVDTLGILSRIVGTGPDAAQGVASVAAE